MINHICEITFWTAVQILWRQNIFLQGFFFLKTRMRCLGYSLFTKDPDKHFFPDEVWDWQEMDGLEDLHDKGESHVTVGCSVIFGGMRVRLDCFQV